MFGLDDISGLVGGGLKMLSNWFQGEQQKSAAEDQYARQLDLSRAQQVYNAGQASYAREFEQTMQQSQFGFNAEQANLARDFSARQQTQAEAFNANQAQLNRDFQERMSSTAYQRSRADMAAAGLNPILAAQAGGASTPGGSAGSIGAVSGPAASGGLGSAAMSSAGLAAAQRRDVPELMSNVISSASELQRLKPQIDQMKALTDTQRAVENRTQAETTYTAQKEAQSRAETDKTMSEKAEIEERTRQMGKQIFGLNLPGITGKSFGELVNTVANPGAQAIQAVTNSAVKYLNQASDSIWGPGTGGR